MISGIGVLATGQAISILVGAMDGYRDAAAWTLLPVAGPWIAGGVAMSDPRGCLVKGPDCGAFPAAPPLIAAGVMQVVGAALIALGVVFPRTTTSRTTLGPHNLTITF